MSDGEGRDDSASTLNPPEQLSFSTADLEAALMPEQTL